MKKKILIILSLVLLISQNIINVYAIPDNPGNNQNNNSSNTSFIKISEEVSIDSDITMTLYLDNIDYDNFTFKLYASELLENVDTNSVDIQNYNNEEITFDYCINCSSLKTIVLNYKLPTSIEIGDSITFNAQIINKDNQEEKENYRTVVRVIDSIKKEEENKDTTEKNKTNFSKVGSINFSSNKTSTSSISSISTKYTGSSINYLSSLSVSGYELNKKFMKERLTYFVTVPNNVKTLNIKTAKESSKSTINISGNSNFSVGLNKVLITVTSENGTVKNYRIYVTRLDSDSSEK